MYPDVVVVVGTARQLTILEFQLFAAIEGRELLNQCWNGENKERDAPNVTLTISRFNQMSGWITTLMVKGAQRYGFVLL